MPLQQQHTTNAVGMDQNTKTSVACWWIFCGCWLLRAVGGSSDFAWLRTNGNLPKLYEYDDFDECRKENPYFQYCVVQAVVVPDESSDTWRNISFLSANPMNFQHDHLERGICLHECMQRIIPSNQQIKASAVIDEDRLAYLSQCVNQALRNSHNLKASTSISHCMSEKDFQHELSFAEKSFVVLVTALLSLICVATLRDFRKTTCKYDDLIKPFSISRNIDNLIDSSKSGGNLAHLEGVRAIGMLIVLLVHSTLPFIRMPLKNTDDMEKQTNSFIFPILNAGNTHMITIFFVLGGMVLSISFLSHIEKHPKVDFTYLWKKLLNRLARLLPPYAFMIFYEATLFKRTKQTPVAHKFEDHCSEHWWSNLLFINNYVHLDEPCMKFGWYLGADFQLFIIGMAIMTLIWRFPRIKKTVAGVMILVSFVVPAYVIYKEQLDATMSFIMSHALTELREYKEFLIYYTPTQVNAGTYFFGMIAGMLHHHASRNNLHIIIQSYLSKLVPVAIVVFISLEGFLAVLATVPQEKPSLFLAIYGSALKAIHGIGNGLLFLMYGFKSNSLVVAFLNHPILTVLARLSYSVYIVQYSIIYMIFSNLTVPVSYNVFNIFLCTSATIFMSFTSGLLLYFAVEVPCAAILKQAIDGKLNIGMFLATRPKNEKLS